MSFRCKKRKYQKKKKRNKERSLYIHVYTAATQWRSLLSLPTQTSLRLTPAKLPSLLIALHSPIFVFPSLYRFEILKPIPAAQQLPPLSQISAPVILFFFILSPRLASPREVTSGNKTAFSRHKKPFRGHLQNAFQAPALTFRRNLPPISCGARRLARAIVDRLNGSAGGGGVKSGGRLAV